MTRYGGAAQVGRIRDAAVRAAAAANGVDDFFAGVMRAVRPVLRSDVWAGITVDPGTLMNTGGYYRQAVPVRYLPRMLDIEYREGDVNGLPQLARGPGPVGVLGEAVGGVRDRSPRYRDIIRPLGLTDEVRILLRDRYGVWGALILGTGRDTPPYGPEADAVARAIARPLGENLRRLHLARRAGSENGGDGGDPAAVPAEGTPAPALVLLDDEYAPVQLSPTAGLWLDELPAPGEPPRPPGTGPGGGPGGWAGRTEGGLPPALYGVAAAVRAPGSAGSLASWAHTRTRGRVRLHAWRLDGPGPGRVAVAVEAAGPGEHIALITAAHGLTPREAEITTLVLHGHSTAEISRLTRLSPYTVQEHLTSVFDKTGVRSRRDLVAVLFARHVEPGVLKSVADPGR
ncbi:helix-turn-helix transcriptional regulator [Streptomyces qinzhouensis]|uniref:LuxR family transcriptional regulator n=1 Tax=Streptomyces qinzhouensis TaxID=2599401 RepID=A0A5B8IS85_9ACTN|nr:LuxR C-terminal-related transcriptional regulator [Streptomyces qinzhouensis]QDY80509.1 LuxR family transcriptional regulator [Streptomyces qinzhouensis]